MNCCVDSGKPRTLQRLGHVSVTLIVAQLNSRKQNSPQNLPVNIEYGIQSAKTSSMWFGVKARPNSNKYAHSNSFLNRTMKSTSRLQSPERSLLDAGWEGKLTSGRVSHKLVKIVGISASVWYVLEFGPLGFGKGKDILMRLVSQVSIIRTRWWLVILTRAKRSAGISSCTTS